MSDEACKVCGLMQVQLPPIQRFTGIMGEMLCLHPFGIPAENVPDWRTHNITGELYMAGVEQFIAELKRRFINMDAKITVLGVGDEGAQALIIEMWDADVGIMRFIRVGVDEVHPAFGKSLINLPGNS